VSLISSIDLDDECLAIAWADGPASRYPWLWVRDHAHDEATLHPVTQQRQLYTAGVRRDLRGTSARVVDDTQVEVSWNDGTMASLLPIEFLRSFRTPSPVHVDVPVERVLWDAEIIEDQWPSVEHEAVMDSDEGVAGWLELVARYGFGMVVGTPPTIEATEALVRRVGYVRETIFGGFWDFQADLSKADTAYTNLELLPHTDGTYSHDAPGLQLLHCLAFDGDGGESTMVDGFRIASELRAGEPELYDVLSTVQVPGQYIGDGAHLMAARPVFRHDHLGALVQVTFNNADRAPFLLPPDEMDAFYEALRAFEALANDHAMQWRRVNRPGNAMLFDNWRVLHGRAAYTGHRHLCGAYINHEDFESRRRRLRSRH
jgi:trimethyllysine dioxygenase